MRLSIEHEVVIVAIAHAQLLIVVIDAFANLMRLAEVECRAGDASQLTMQCIDAVTVAGLATDYCVKHTALDALREGFAVTVDSAGVRGVELQPGDSKRALDELRAAGVRVV